MRPHSRISLLAASLVAIGVWLGAPGVAGAHSHATSHTRSPHHSRSRSRGRHRQPRLVSWNFTTTFTYAAPGQPFPAGSTALERIVYDPRKVDSAGNVVIAGHQHYLGGAWAPITGPDATPVSNLSIFNVKNQTLSYDVQVTHGNPIVLVYTPYKITAIYSQIDGSLFERGTYAFSSSGPQPCNARTWYASGTC